jgi:hypothetical protein
MNEEEPINILIDLGMQHGFCPSNAARLSGGV